MNKIVIYKVVIYYDFVHYGCFMEWSNDIILEFWARFSDSDRSLNRKRERFKGFEVGPRSNRGRTVMTS